MENTHHSFKAENGTVNNWDAQLHAGVVQQVAAREVVGTVDNDVVASNDVHDVACIEARVVSNHVDIGVHERECLFCTIYFAIANAVEVVQNLALQVRRINNVHVDDANGAYTSCS